MVFSSRRKWKNWQIRGCDRFAKMNANNGTINLKVITGAQQTELCEIMDDGSLKVKLHAKPVEGKANLELIELLAEELGISRQAIEIISGSQSRRKVVRVIGINQYQLNLKIKQKTERQDP